MLIFKSKQKKLKGDLKINLCGKRLPRLGVKIDKPYLAASFL